MADRLGELPRSSNIKRFWPLKTRIIIIRPRQYYRTNVLYGSHDDIRMAIRRDQGLFDRSGHTIRVSGKISSHSIALVLHSSVDLQLIMVPLLFLASRLLRSFRRLACQSIRWVRWATLGDAWGLQ